MLIFRFIGLVVLFVLSLLSILHSIDSGDPTLKFSLQNQPVFDWRMSWERLLIGAQNTGHIKGFLVMSLIALLSFEKRRLFWTLIFVGSLSIITEGLQVWTPFRHGRLTDIVPNLLGMSLALLIFYSFFTFKRNKSNKR